MIQCASVEKSGQQNSPAPWEITSNEVGRFIRERLELDCLLVATLDLKSPKADEVMVVAGDVQRSAVAGMLRQLPISDATLQNAITNGEAQTKLIQSASRVLFADWESLATGSALYIVLPQAYCSGCAWFLTACRRHGSFDADEINTLRRFLNQWAARFSTPNEPNMVRMLVGHDDRTILIDPAGEQYLIDHAIDHSQLIHHIHAVEKQRWSETTDDETHDLTLAINGAPWWIRLHHRNALGVREGDQCYIELRRLAAEEMTAVDLISDQRVAKSLALIHDHYCHSLTLEEISSSVGISLFHFHRLFSQHVGVTPKQYILQKQIQVARWMLRSRRMPVSQIAELTGFASHGHFTSTFSRIVGMSPSAYRGQAQELQPQ